MIPGEYFIKDGFIDCNAGRKTQLITVTNLGDRPIQVGSHYHFFEVNTALEFQRDLAYGMRLNVAAGTGIRFEPSEEKEVELVAFAGNRIITGFNNAVNKPLP